MAHVSYTPTFHHIDWVDKIDRVEADGPNGFNTRFNAIGADLHELSSVVKQISDAIAVFQAPPPPPPPQPQLMSFTPVLRSLPRQGKPWATAADGTAVARTNAIGGVYFGLTNLTLPGKVRLSNMRVKGIFIPDDIGEAFAEFFLMRTPLVPTGQSPVVEPLASANVGATGVETYDQQATPPDPVTAQIDPDQFRYFLTVRFEMPDQVQLRTLMTIETVQLTFVPA